MREGALSMISRRPSAAALFVALAAGGLAAATFLYSIVAGWFSYPVETAMAAMLILGTPLLRYVAARARVPRAEAVAALAPVAMAPVLFAGALHSLSQPLTEALYREWDADEDAVLELAPVVFALGMSGGFAAVGWLARGGAWREATLRVLAVATLGVASALLAWSAARATRFPPPDAYLSSLPRVATVPGLSGMPRDEVRRELLEPIPDLPLVLEWHCTYGYCEFALAKAPLGSAPDVADFQGADTDATITIQRDAAHGLWVVGEGWSRPQVYRETDSKVELAAIDARDVRDAVSPPRGWIIGAAIGLIFAAWLLSRRRSARSFLARVERATAGTLDEQGWITFGTGAPPVYAGRPKQGSSPGPVLVTGSRDGAAPMGAYRGEAPLGGGEVIAGERSSLVEQSRETLAGLDALTISSAALSAAPLLASWSCLGW